MAASCRVNPSEIDHENPLCSASARSRRCWPRCSGTLLPVTRTHWQFFKADMRQRLIPSNPFEGIVCNLKENRSRFHFVSCDDAAKVIQASPFGKVAFPNGPPSLSFEPANPARDVAAEGESTQTLRGLGDLCRRTKKRRAISRPAFALTRWEPKVRSRIESSPLPTLFEPVHAQNAILKITLFGLVGATGFRQR